MNDGDFIHALASVDGVWEAQSLDLANVPDLGNLLGRQKVWIAFYFESDAGITGRGPFLDSIELRIFVPTSPAPPTPPNHGTDGARVW
jgi:hypothetical protein